jgi:hypothetical protein
MDYARLMVVMTPRETWTDQRLDDLNKKVDKGFADVDARLVRLENRLDAKFDGLNRTLIASAAVVVAALLGIIATLIGVAVF